MTCPRSHSGEAAVTWPRGSSRRLISAPLTRGTACWLACHRATTAGVTGTRRAAQRGAASRPGGPAPALRSVLRCPTRWPGTERDSPPGARASLREGRLCVPVRGPGPRAAPPFLVLVTPFLLPRSTAELPVAKGQRVAHSRPPGVCQMTE